MNIIFLKIVFGSIFHIFLNFIFKRIKFFKDDISFSKHKELATEKKGILLTGGISLLILFCLFFQGNYQLKLFCFFILMIGLLSDLNLISNPLKRFTIQTIILIIFINQFSNNITYTDIFFLDFILKYKLISYFFTIYCFLVIINGTNFIDGLNGLVLGYYILSVFTLLMFIISKDINYDDRLIKLLLIILIINYPFNFFGKNFLGDSGSYLIAFLVGFVFIDFYNSYKDISALFIATLLWYPAFENLFSIIRKKIEKRDPSKPDTNHIHQLIFKILINKLKNKKKTNIVSGLVINIYNFLVFFIAFFLANSSIGLSILLVFNIIIYSSSYLILSKKLKN